MRTPLLYTVTVTPPLALIIIALYLKLSNKVIIIFFSQLRGVITITWCDT